MAKAKTKRASVRIRSTNLTDARWSQRRVRKVIVKGRCFECLTTNSSMIVFVEEGGILAQVQFSLLWDIAKRYGIENPEEEFNGQRAAGEVARAYITNVLSRSSRQPQNVIKPRIHKKVTR